MNNKNFKILSIDGGGIRGIYPAMLLAEYEANLRANGVKNWQVYQNFDLICGTSTGGIIAIALGLGIPAKDIYEMYMDNADKIFGSKKSFFSQLFRSSHSRGSLEELVRQKFKDYHDGTDGDDPRLKHCKTNIAIPIYDLLEGRPSVLKTRHHEAFVRDFHIPAYQVALATSAAPTYFDPYSAAYTDLNGIKKPFQNKVDGGVYANNPTLNGIIEAQKAFDVKLEDLAVLSIGTGHQKFSEAGVPRGKAERRKYGLYYWMKKDNRKRLIELFMQGQSQQIQNLISLMKNGIDKREPDNFVYLRLDAELDESCVIEMDEVDADKLNKLAEKATITFQSNATNFIQLFGDGNRQQSNQ